jgi:hypothetical protein
VNITALAPVASDVALFAILASHITDDKRTRVSGFTVALVFIFAAQLVVRLGAL